MGPQQRKFKQPPGHVDGDDGDDDHSPFQRRVGAVRVGEIAIGAVALVHDADDSTPRDAKFRMRKIFSPGNR